MSRPAAALPDELVERICHPPAPPPPPWLPELATLVAQELEPVIRTEIRAALEPERRRVQ